MLIKYKTRIDLNSYFMKVMLMKVLVFNMLLLVFTSFIFAATDKLDTLTQPVSLKFDTIVKENVVFQSLDYLTEDEIYGLIDSLLDLESIPQELVTEIQLAVKCKYDEIELQAGISDSLNFPANQYYNKWDTYNTHPYPESISKNDTSLELVLSSEMSIYSHPFIGLVTSNFGDGRNHSGIDIDLEVWDPVVAAFDGVVRIVRKHGGYGRVVVVRHYNGLETLYAHLHRFKVAVGDKVKAGQVVGLGGSSGHSSGSHLHFETRFKGKPLNPKHFVNFKTHQLYSDTIVLHKTKWSYAVTPKGVKYHNVEKGEFLYIIAKRYSTSIYRLCELNGISRNSILRVGQKLRIS